MWKTLFFLQGNVTCLAVGLVGGTIIGMVFGYGIYDVNSSKKRTNKFSYSNFAAD